ncbi:CHAT domain-containing tetratricopeptide repeat protein [Hymenobacter terrestris]|uniref:CHAT domain-containing protein n=1 Tax=Hymenobacter terrestris TaxID=2748310 RepID=A0ABX2Q002_9BACT|nr:CHAT domain-containing tetratricopeptide repeat protein [Hymenobacter terrestris]NVO84265.1 CHAT domain-containing protein [Hymenobacter terrestris]
MSCFPGNALNCLPVLRRHLLALAVVLALLGGRQAWGQANSASRINSLNRQVHRYIYYNAARYEQGVRLAEQTVEAARQALGEHHRSYVTSLNNLAVLYTLVGRYAEAEPLLKVGLGVRKQAFEQHSGVMGFDYDAVLYAVTLDNLADHYRIMGRLEEAERIGKELIAVSRRTFNRYPLMVVINHISHLESFAHIYLEQGRNAEAAVICEEIMAVEKRYGFRLLFPARHRSSLSNLAVVYEHLGRLQEATALHMRAVAIARKNRRKHPDKYANSLRVLATNYELTRRYAGAEPLIKEVLAIYEQTFGPHHPYYAAVLNDLSSIYALTGRYAAAEAASAQGNAIWLNLLRRTLPGLSEREKQQFLATISRDTERYHSLLAQQVAPASEGTARAYDQVLFTKGLLLATTAGLERRLRASEDTTVIRSFKHWQTLKRQLATAYSLPLAQQQKRGLDPVRLDSLANELERSLTVGSAAFRREAGMPTTTQQQVQQALKSGEVAVELVRYRWFRRSFTDTIYYSAYITTPTSAAPQLVVLKNGNELEQRAMQAYRRLHHTPVRTWGSLSVSSTRGPADAKSLYETYWGPIARAIPPGTSTVYLSADGVYLQLNLATLQNPATGRYLLDELDLRLVGSTRDLLRSPQPDTSPSSRPAHAVLVGDPAFRIKNLPANPPEPAPGALPPATFTAALPVASATPRSTYSRSDYWLAAGEVSPLPGTARELAALDSLLRAANWPNQQLVGAAATEENVRQVRRPRVLHLATHGFFLAAAPVGKGPPDAVKGELANDAMLRAGLLLAGVSNFRDAPSKPDTEDGILTAYEASLLDLQGTELVVLSACETGLGQVQAGEGVYGLQRGFTVAGARTLMMSLWKVDDAVTQELMTTFYRFWLAGSSKRAALLAAQQQVRKQHPEPYYWGAFVLVGE